MKKTKTALNFSADVFPARLPALANLLKKQARLKKDLWTNREKMARSYSEIPPASRAEFMKHFEDVFSPMWTKYLLKKGQQNQTVTEINRQKFYGKYFKQVGQWFIFYQKDAERIFAKKFSSTIEETEMKARKGDLKSLCNLISFDKRYLYEEWAKTVVIGAQYGNNKKVLSAIGAAIRSNFGYRDQGRKHVELEKYLRLHKLKGHDFTKWEKAKSFAKYLDKECGDSILSETHVDFEDLQEFWKYLKRIGLR